jgi:hypothetical protein
MEEAAAKLLFNAEKAPLFAVAKLLPPLAPALNPAAAYPAAY